MHALFEMDCYASWLLSSILLLYILLLCSCRVDYCYASLVRDTLKQGDWITDNGATGLVSSGGRFELGFFTPIRSSSPKRFVGIWYHKWDKQTVVWVANRNKPVLNGSTGTFGIAEDGSLKVSDTTGKEEYWYRYYGTPNVTVKLMDSGNLVLSYVHNQSVTSLWESFKSTRTDTFLPGMDMDGIRSLTSWTSDGDPGRGKYRFNKKEGTYVISKAPGIEYWRRSWITDSSEAMPDDILYLLSNVSNSGNYRYERLVMNYTGELQYHRSSGVDQGNLSLNWSMPEHNNCSISNFCGHFGSCNINNRPFECKCLPGFHPNNLGNWNSRKFLDGCTRSSTALEKSDTFLSLNMMKVSEPTYFDSLYNESECRKQCLNNSQCQAYSFDYSYLDNCGIWTEDLRNLQEEYTKGVNLSVRVAKSVIGSTPRNCEPCGTNLIPYPLSIGRNCGDLMYFNFYCNNSTGQVNFTMPNGSTYRVVSIDPSKRIFLIIQVKYAGNYITGLQQLNKSFLFHPTIDSGNYSSEVRDAIEISWTRPLEPSCSSSNDCKDWPNSTCNEAKDGNRRCLCTKNFHWNGSNLNCTKEEKLSLILIVMIPLIVVFLLASAIVCIYMRRRKIMAKTQENQRKRALRALDNEKHVKDLIDSVEFTEEDKKDIDVPFFDLESILAATNSFSDANKLGEGGYGPVYKGTFSGGQQIALKRLSCVSGQGLQEFKNEVVLIAKLQHRNLVSLRGYCVKGYEKILLYEYMPNKSLDSFIFDKKLSMSLDWEMRFKIILGIARGLVYFHHDSRLRIIHRDMKTSNILLDEEMNPKISDFGLARMIEGKETEASTIKLAGTYGYMSPEYTQNGMFSFKSDVFSFGVVLLEIISGRKNDAIMSLIGYAWRLLDENKVLDLVDQTLREDCNADQLAKCVNIGFLCLQDDPNDRPTMLNVVTMLDSEAATIPTPKRPSLVPRSCLSSTTSSFTRLDTVTESTSSFGAT
ncbi:G-type lectin S-receptor-like serine/threonine-protein kinase At4g03230 [Corylus avellana]|uniref:G-type lectin S-receptor-like serine/threonine-protein kinase At4g03230 n=1 Tax=Corylus avellana TaxID=13451 RepID=UPI00286B8F58|nr:G-type lectin S-receptor-like serine/threonine-protein kinase At4g03230 [Corylus avellana]